MGLDMFLYQKQHAYPSDTGVLTIKREGGDITIPISRSTSFVEEIGYWRKANQIHKWFVDHVQRGEDDCREYNVSRDQLRELQHTITKVLASTKLVPGEITTGFRYEQNKEVPITQAGKVVEDATVAKKLLPTQEGFFFGGYDYDEFYVADLENTRYILAEALRAPDDGSVTFSYQSSWYPYRGSALLK